MDIEKSPVVAEECLVMDVPAVQIFKGGVEREALRGRVTMQEVGRGGREGAWKERCGWRAA